MNPPVVVPKKKLKATSVGLEPELWVELQEVADHETLVFKALKQLDESGSVSRNEVMGSFLRWALTEWWKVRGGRPLSKQEKAERVRADIEARSRQTKTP